MVYLPHQIYKSKNVLHAKKKLATDAETTKASSCSQKASKQSPPLSRNGGRGALCPDP